MRLAAAEEISKSPRADAIAPMRAALQKESDPRVRTMLELGLAQVQLSSDDPKLRLEAIAMISESGNLGLKPQLEALVAKREDGSFAEPDPTVRLAAATRWRALRVRSFLSVRSVICSTVSV